MIIAFVHNGKAFLPEMDAYTRFFSACQITCEVVNRNELGLLHRHVEWWMMGVDLTKPKEGIYKIHEYGSSSLPPWRWWKNWWKSFFNAQPDFRLFLNEYVQKAFNFHDHIPFGYRDMGVPEHWLQTDPFLHERDYDFVYTGDLSPIRRPEALLKCFSTGAMKGKTLLIIGRDYEHLQEAYASYRNIIFMGPLPHHLLDFYILRARFGINYTVDMEPFSHQTSVKLLEYAALGLPIISTRYAWVEQFQRQYGGEFFYLEPDLSNFTWEAVSNFPYARPAMETLTWDQQIRKSGVLTFLESKFPELQFTPRP
ncbi:glycosyltransferase [Longitalea luteola]|uniref:glycosyltransferase n=1 Tax=Longitalea luteola TaxID=2812563 RepID=UPI001A96BCF2|nr:glycosyltransferase [Longitalea luteola]